MSSPLLPRLVSSSVAVVNHAGTIIRDIMTKGDLGIVTKEHAKDLQTKADRAAQSSIIGSLSRQFPSIKIIGEEDEIGGTENLVPEANIKALDLKCPEKFNTLKEEEIVVWVDPLDGTAEYTQAHECIISGHEGVCKTIKIDCASLLDHVTVLVGIAAGGKAVGGIVHQPYFNYQHPDRPLGRTIYAIVDGCIGGMDVVAPPKDGCIVTTTRSHSSSTVNDAVSSVNPTDVLRVGGAGHKVLLLLEGLAHAYVFASPGCKKWDTCAPEAILSAAGGSLTDIKGDKLPYDAGAPHRNSNGVLATAPGLDHQSFVDKIPSHVKNDLKA